MYIDGFVGAVPKANKDKYLKHLEEAALLFKEFGASGMVENWGDDVPLGEVTDFYKAVAAKEDEVVVFSWIQWPSKEVRDEGIKKMMADERMKTMEMPFDGKRMIYGGFSTIFNERF